MTTMLDTLDDDQRAAIFRELRRLGWSDLRAANQLLWSRRDDPPTAPSHRLAEPGARR